MKNKYVLKMCGFYLSKYELDKEQVNTNFLSGLYFTTDINKAIKLIIDKALPLSKVIYIETGIDFEIVEVKNENK